jgi:hypothetical protein
MGDALRIVLKSLIFATPYSNIASYHFVKLLSVRRSLAFQSLSWCAGGADFARLCRNLSSTGSDSVLGYERGIAQARSFR